MDLNLNKLGKNYESMKYICHILNKLPSKVNSIKLYLSNNKFGKYTENFDILSATL